MRTRRTLSCSLLLICSFLAFWPWAQEGRSETDFRLFRAPNHILVVARSLAEGEAWSGPVYTEDQTRYAIISWGSSCAVSEQGHLLTNDHIVRQAEVILVGGWNDSAQLVRAELLRQDEKNDLALLKIDAPNSLAWIATFQSTQSLREGEDIFLWGYLQIPGGFAQFLRHGIVSMNTALPSGFEQFLYIEVSASFGTSGSPVFTRSGKPIGLVSTAITLPGGRQLPAGILGVIPGETITNFLKEAKVPGY